jgi:hypothetical protein
LNIGNGGSSNVNFTSGITGPTGSFNYLAGNTGQFNYLVGNTGQFDYLTVNDGFTGATGTFDYLTVNDGFTGASGFFGTLNIGSGFATYTNDNSTEYTSTTLVSKQYVDTFVSGISVKAAVTAATVSTDDYSSWSYNNGIITVPSGLTLDGVTISSNQYVLIKDFTTNEVANGIYTYDENVTLTRRSDMAQGADITTSYVFVEQGSTQASTAWTSYSDISPLVIGTTAFTFNKFTTFSFQLGNGLFKAPYSGIEYISVDNSLNFINYLDSVVGPTASTGILNIGSVTNTLNIGNGGSSNVNFTSGITGPTGSFNYLAGNTGQFNYLAGNTGQFNYLLGNTGSFNYLQGVTGSYFTGISSNLQTQITTNTNKTQYMAIGTDAVSNTITGFTGPVMINTFSSNTPLTGSTSAKKGTEISWSASGFNTEFTNYGTTVPYSGNQGFKFYNLNSINPLNKVFSIDGSGNVTNPGTITSGSTITAPSFSGTVTNATNATNVYTTNTTTSGTYALVFATTEDASLNNSMNTSSLYYNPSTATMTLEANVASQDYAAFINFIGTGGLGNTVGINLDTFSRTPTSATTIQAVDNSFGSNNLEFYTSPQGVDSSSNYYEQTLSMIIVPQSYVSSGYQSYVGINRSNPTQALHVTGGIKCTESAYATSFQTTSDHRIKSNVLLLDDTFTVDNLRPVSYHNEHSGKQGIGFIAHEVQEVFPSLVNGEKDDVYEDGELKYQSLEYTGIIAILVKEIQELKRKVHFLQQQLV